MSKIALMKEDGDTDQEIGDDRSESSTEPTLSSDIVHEDLDYQPEVLLLGHASWDKSVRTTRDPFPKKQSHVNTVIASPPHPKSVQLLWATGLGTPPAVQVWTRNMTQLGSSPIQEPDCCVLPFQTRTRTHQPPVSPG